MECTSNHELVANIKYADGGDTASQVCDKSVDIKVPVEEGTLCEDSPNYTQARSNHGMKAAQSESGRKGVSRAGWMKQ